MERVGSHRGEGEQMCPPPLLEASVPSCRRRSWMPTRAGRLPWPGRLQGSPFPAGARGKATTDPTAEATAKREHTQPQLGVSPTLAGGHPALSEVSGVRSRAATPGMLLPSASSDASPSAPEKVLPLCPLSRRPQLNSLQCQTAPFASSVSHLLHSGTKEEEDLFCWQCPRVLV